MKRETYQKMTESIDQKPVWRGVIIWTDTILTKLAYVAYPAFLLSLMIKKEPAHLILQALLVPGISFILVSVFRSRYNAPRPYEVFGLPSVIKKDTKGHSFPSRHLFSIFVIAATIFYFYPSLGLDLMAVGGVLAVVRVLGGVHFPRDVIGGAFIGLFCGVIGFYIL